MMHSYYPLTRRLSLLQILLLLLLGSVRAAAQNELPPLDTAQWQLVLSDDFDGKELNRSLWHSYGNWAGMESDNWAGSRHNPGDMQIYLDDQVVVDSGICHLLLSRQDVRWACDTCADTFYAPFAAGEIYTYYTRPFLFGRYEARLKMPAAPNTHATFWLWPGANMKEEAGIEIDIAEGYGGPVHATPFSGRKNRHVNFVLHHWGPSGHDHVLKRFPGQSWWHALRGLYFDISEWHTYTLDWLPQEMRLYVDGRLVRVFTTKDIPWLTDAKPCNIRLSMAIGEQSDEPYGLVDAFLIDYVRVWERK